MGTYTSDNASSALPDISAEASLLAHIIGGDVDGALTIAEAMSPIARQRFTAQLTTAKNTVYAATVAANARTEFIAQTEALLEAAYTDAARQNGA